MSRKEYTTAEELALISETFNKEQPEWVKKRRKLQEGREEDEQVQNLRKRS